MHARLQNLLAIHSAVFLFGLSGLFVKFIELPSTLIVFGRVFFASIALALLLLFKQQGIRLQTQKDYLGLAFLGIVLALHWWAFFASIQRSTVAIGVITYSTFPVFVAFFEPLFFRKQLRGRDILLAIITFAGAVLAIPSLEFGSHMVQGALLGMLSAASFALLSILNRRYVQRYGSLVIALYQDVVAALILFPFILSFSATVTSHDVLLIILLGVVFTAGAHALFIHGMTSIEAKTASIIGSLEAVYGIFFAALLLSEIPSMRTLVGGGVVLLATMYATSMVSSHDQTSIATT